MKDKLLALYNNQNLSDADKSKCNMVITRLQKMVDKRYGLKGEVYCYMESRENNPYVYFCASFNGLIEDSFLYVSANSFELFDEYYIDATEFSLFTIENKVYTKDIEDKVLSNNKQYKITSTMTTETQLENIFSLLYPGADYNIVDFSNDESYCMYHRYDPDDYISRYYIFDENKKLVLVYINDSSIVSKIFLTDNAEVLQKFKSIASAYITSTLAIDIIDNNMDLNVLL